MSTLKLIIGKLEADYAEIKERTDREAVTHTDAINIEIEEGKLAYIESLMEFIKGYTPQDKPYEQLPGHIQDDVASWAEDNDTDDANENPFEYSPEKIMKAYLQENGILGSYQEDIILIAETFNTISSEDLPILDKNS